MPIVEIFGHQIGDGILWLVGAIALAITTVIVLSKIFKL